MTILTNEYEAEHTIIIEKISKSFGEKRVLMDFSAKIKRGSITALSGPSGVGKTTLLNIIGLLDNADIGKIYYYGDEIIKPFTKKASYYLRTKIGYLFQNFALINEENVLYNLMISLEHSKLSKAEKLSQIDNALCSVGLQGYENKKIYTCSGGEQQRIAIAGILLKENDLILADEPTGSLDDANAQIILDLLLKMKSSGKTIVIVTHDNRIIDMADYNIRL